MSRYSLLLVLLVGIFSIFNAEGEDSSSFRYVGGDISLLPEYEGAGSQYKNLSGEPINDVLKFCYDEGMNCMRVRLFVNPQDYTGEDKDPNACQDLDYIIPLCRRIKNEGFSLILDFHYSDTWADPSKQWTPKAWEGLSDQELYQKIYDYTKECLETLKANEIIPDFIQPGNEISYGMLWGPAGTNNPLKVYTDNDANWERFGKLLDNAILACREICPEADIIIHNERIANLSVLLGFYKRMKDMNIDYDIIGLSYYPYFHGDIRVLNNALSALEIQFASKNIMIVETGYAYAWEVPGTDQKVDYPYTEDGQAQFAKELVETLLKYKKCNGLLWWWFEYNAFGSSLSGWYNAPLFDSRTGKVTKAFAEICSFGTGHNSGSGIKPYLIDDEKGYRWFDLQGRPIPYPSAPGLYIRSGYGETTKIIVRRSE